MPYVTRTIERAITEFTPPRSRRIRRIVTLPATLLERLDAIIR
jgi:hypothetical protein